MHTIPVIVLDNFLENPDMMRKFALSQEFYIDDQGRWPGTRSKPLHELDPGIFENFTKKFFSIFFNIEEVGWTVEAKFQKISSQYGSGWAHTDPGPIITGILYLDRHFCEKSGTTILEKKQLDSNSSMEYRQDEKIKFYQGKISKEEADELRTRNNSCFVDSIKISSKYNRLIAFDSNLIHTAEDFIGQDREDRLTLVFFVKDISTSRTPVFRSKIVIL